MKVLPSTQDRGTIVQDDKNNKIGYVENDVLFAIDRDGYAVEVGPVSHSIEIEPKLTAWRNSKGLK